MHAIAIAPDEFIPTRQTLLIRLRNWSDNESWKQFFELYWRLIYHAAITAGLSDAEAQDVVQETIVALSKSLPQFEYDPQVGSFKGYLLKLTSWKIKDQLKRRLPKAVGFTNGDTGSNGTAMARLADPKGFESYWNQEWEKNLMEVARERVKKKVNPKHYQIFDLNIDQGWPIHKVADKLGVNAAFVYVVRHRVTRLLAREIKKLQAKDHNEN